MKKFLSVILLAVSVLTGWSREILLLEGPFKADWSDKHTVDPMKMVGVAVGDRIHVYTSNLGQNATAYIRTRSNGWAAISKEYNNIRITGDIECVLDETLLKVIDNQELMFGGSDYTIEKVTLITDREEDTRVGYDDLCDPDATPETKAVYELLRDAYGNQSLSCSMAEVDWNYKEAGHVKNWTGKYPAINGFDYIHLVYDWESYRDITPVKEWWDMGGLVTMMWHWRAPTSEAQWTAYKNKKTHKDNECFEGFYCNGAGSPNTDFSAANALIEGTWENEFVKYDLAKIAERLKLIQKAGIPVIWRPLHEAAGNSTIYNDGKAWFWWGNDGAEACVGLYKMMFDYFKEQGIHNLIWCWTSQTKDAAWYPGDEYVDLIGRDLYNYSLDDAVYNFNYLTAYYPHKMITLSECGYSGGSSPYMSEQWEAGAKWLFAMPWYDYGYKGSGNHQYANEDWWTDWFKQDNNIAMPEMKTMRAQYLNRSGIETPEIAPEAQQTGDDAWYNLQGIRISEPTAPGIYIRNGRKIQLR